MKTHLFFVLIATLFISCKKENNIDERNAQTPDQTEINKLSLNQIQTLGSHNSYHIRMDEKLFSFLTTINFILPEEYKVDALDYDHEPLDMQLNKYKMRSFEIDIYADPDGGKFYNRQGNLFNGIPVASGIDELRKPGFKVLHIPDIDYKTHFYTFKSMLQALKTWSDAHPNHIPITLLIETKEETVGDILGFLGFTTAIKFTPALCDDIDTEIKSVFGDDLAKVITPDKVRGTFATLKDAVLANNWPTIGEARGKFIFVMEGGAHEEYLSAHPSLRNRAMFVYADNNDKDESAFLIYNNPIRNNVDIRFAVSNNYIVRTRSDGPNNQNKSGDYTQQNAAFNSGAQVISTDYYRADPRSINYPSKYKPYSCQFPNGDLARINPISAADKQGIGKIAE
ncbi:MAG TPA: Ca2+-dependent phosphoinositide-specific phospholipase C [Chitinophagales bacterium]|nr:Ca2+-dependent phosphoinositide-specific phospholipase C [Chitinophagales bacterium]